MLLTNHAVNRICKRNKEASYMSKKAIEALVNKAKVILEGETSFYLLESIDLVLVCVDSNVVTCYRQSLSKFKGVL